MEKAAKEVVELTEENIRLKKKIFMLLLEVTDNEGKSKNRNN